MRLGEDQVYDILGISTMLDRKLKVEYGAPCEIVDLFLETLLVVGDEMSGHTLGC